MPTEISGVIDTVLRREGDTVEKGEPAVRLRDNSYRLDVETKRIMAQQAAAKVGHADLARREGEKMVAQKRLALTKAESVYKRTADLAASGGIISPEEEEEKRIDVEHAKLDLATRLLQAEKFELEYRESEQAKKLAQVDLQTAEYLLSQTVLRAPIAGEISYLRAKPGELVAANTRVFTVVQLDELEARLSVPQRELERLRIGLPMILRCDVFPGKMFSGTVEVINPVIEENGSVQVLAGIKDPERFLKPGLFVSGEIILDTREDAVLVPKKAVSYVKREPVIFLVKDNVARRYVVEAGYSNQDSIEVRALRALDGSPATPEDGALVLVGHDGLRDGSKVEVATEESE